MHCTRQTWLTLILSTLQIFCFAADSIRGTSDLPITDKPLIRHIGLVAPDTVFLEIHALEVDRQPPRPFTLTKDDRIKLSGYEVLPQLAEAAGIKDFLPGQRGPKVFRQVYRNDKFIGYLIGFKDNWHISPVHPFIGQRLDVDWAAKPASYTLSSSDDPTYGDGKNAVKISRKSQPRTGANQGDWGMEWSEQHFVFVKFPEALSSGKTYTLRFNDTQQFPTAVTFTFDPQTLRSEAIQVNQNGHHPKSHKIAYLSTWTGKGGGIDYSFVKQFQLVDADKNVVLTGTPKKIEDTLNDKNLTNAPVYGLNFSDVTQPGVYRVVVPEIGCSYPVRIQADVWTDVFRTVMKGYLHQRSGIEIKPPMLKTAHPLEMHPKMGFKVHNVDLNKFYKTGDIFKAIQLSIQLDTENPDAWGGWRDAGDSDRQADHMHAVGDLVAAWEANPAFFEKLDLGIPESGNKIPDILDEALWCAELFRRTQFPDGGVPSFIEAIEHPRAGEFGKFDSLPWAVAGPTHRDNWIYAANQAYLALALKRYDKDLADACRDSALRAAEWVLNTPKHPSRHFKASQMPQERAMTGAALFRLTGDEKWHQLFKNNVNLDKFKNYNWARFSPAKLVYLLAKTPSVDKALHQQIKADLLAEAETIIELSQRTMYHSARSLWPENRTWGMTWPTRIQELTAAQIVAPDKKYVQAIEDAFNFALGANPKNLVYISGIGQNQLYPYDIRVWQGVIDAPPGIPAQGYKDHYGKDPDKPKDRVENPRKRAGKAIYPTSREWPDAESFFYGGAGYEHTVQFMGRLAQPWGVLAAYYESK